MSQLLFADLGFGFILLFSLQALGLQRSSPMPSSPLSCGRREVWCSVWRVSYSFSKPRGGDEWKYKAPTFNTSVPGLCLGGCGELLPASALGHFQGQRDNGSGGQERILPTYTFSCEFQLPFLFMKVTAVSLLDPTMEIPRIWPLRGSLKKSAENREENSENKRNNKNERNLAERLRPINVRTREHPFHHPHCTYK